MATSKTKTVYPLAEYLAKHRVNPVAEPASDKPLHKVIDGGITKKTSASSLKRSQIDLDTWIQQYDAAEARMAAVLKTPIDQPATWTIIESDDKHSTRSSSLVSSNEASTLSSEKAQTSPATSFPSSSETDQSVKTAAPSTVDKVTKSEPSSLQNTQAGRVVKKSSPEHKQPIKPNPVSLAVSLALGMEAGVKSLPTTAQLLGEREQAAQAHVKKTSAEKTSAEKASAKRTSAQRALAEKLQAAMNLVAARTPNSSTNAVKTTAANSSATKAEPETETVVDKGMLDMHRVRGGRRILVSKLCINGYRPVERIHLGNDSSIWRAEHKDSARSIAIKFPHEHFRNHRDGKLNVWIRECDFHHRAARNHAGHVVQLVPDMTSVDPENSNGLYLGMELMDGNCSDHLGWKRMDEDIEKDVYLLIAQVTSSLESLHGRSIVHNNLAPQNILFKREMSVWGGEKEEKIVWKLADFGFATDNQSLSFQKSKSVARWTAPEIAEMEFNRMVTSADIWPLWCLMVIFLNWGNCWKWMPNLTGKETPEALSEYRAAMANVTKCESRARWWKDMGCNSGTGRPSAKIVMDRLREHRCLEFKNNACGK